MALERTQYECRSHAIRFMPGNNSGNKSPRVPNLEAPLSIKTERNPAGFLAEISLQLKEALPARSRRRSIRNSTNARYLSNYFFFNFASRSFPSAAQKGCMSKHKCNSLLCAVPRIIFFLLVPVQRECWNGRN